MLYTDADIEASMERIETVDFHAVSIISMKRQTSRWRLRNTVVDLCLFLIICIALQKWSLNSLIKEPVPNVKTEQTSVTVISLIESSLSFEMFLCYAVSVPDQSPGIG